MEKVLLIQIRTPGELNEGDIFQQLLTEIKSSIPANRWRLENNVEENWCNIEMHSSDPLTLWADLLARIHVIPEVLQRLSNQWIVVCEGNDGWSDFRTLAHFDSTVKLDLPST